MSMKGNEYDLSMWLALGVSMIGNTTTKRPKKQRQIPCPECKELMSTKLVFCSDECYESRKQKNKLKDNNG